MKPWRKIFLAGLLGVFTAGSTLAQQPPILTVSLTDVAVLSGTGSVALILLTNQGTGYALTPGVVISAPPAGPGNTTATAVATINSSGVVTNIIITDGGSGYTSAPTITIDAPTGGGPPTPITATALAYVGRPFHQPTQNESYGPAGTSIALTALAVGTFPASGFTYEFFANGISLGTAAAHPLAGTPATIGWTPPQPGSYFITVTASDGAHTATSLPVRYFATGTMITNPTPNTIVPKGSSIVVQATATPQPLTGLPGGSGYTSVPSVAITGGGGSGAAATAVTTNGVISIAVNAGGGGSGYTSVPAVTIAAPGGGGTTATATATVNFTTGAVTGITVTSHGSGYAGTPTVTIAAPGGGGTTATATATVSSVVDSFTGLVAGSGYTSAPIVTITGGGGTEANAFATINTTTGQVTAVALTGSDTFVARIDFYADGVLIGSDTTAPYSLIYTPANTPATHTLEARAYDNNGNQVSPNGTAVQGISMVPPIGTPPTCVISSPANNAILPIPGSGAPGISVAVSAGSPTGLITKVELYVDGVLFGTATTFPYSFTWTPTVVGDYHLIALAYDDKSNVVASSIAPADTKVTVAASPTVTLTAPAAGTTVSVGSTVTLTAQATDSNVGGGITSVQFFAGGTLVGSASTPTSGNNYSYDWAPTTAGAASITAMAFNKLGLYSQTAAVSLTVTSSGGGGGGGTPPTVSIITPVSSSVLPVNTPQIITATASSATGTVTSVKFLANGVEIGSATAFPYTVTWTPTTPGSYALTAIATDNSGGLTTSAASNVTITAGTAPSVSISSPASNSSVPVGSTQTIVATATAGTGTLTSVQFFANGVSLGTTTTFPYNQTWVPAGPGTVALTAVATNSLGNRATSAVTNVTVATVNPGAPTVSLTSPANGSVVRAGSSITLNATASDSDGTIASVQFYANGVAIGTPVSTITSAGYYTTQWTLAASGIYTLTATAVDNAGAATSTSATVLGLNAASGGGDTVYTGSFFGLGENGRFAVINASGKTAAFIGYSTLGAGKVYFYPSIPVDAARGFTLTDATGRVLVAGSVGDTAATITTLDGAPITLIGMVAFPAGTSVASGYYTGSLSGRPTSQLAAIVGPDGSIALFATDGSIRTAGAGVVDSTGAFRNIAALGGGVFTGLADPATKFLSGSLTGPLAGGLLGAIESGVSFSDGFLRNLSARGQVGTGTNVLVAGFVVGGTTPKQVLIRAIGPSLTQFGITGALADPYLQLFGGTSGTAQLASNDNWGGAVPLFNASNAVGAFLLSPTSLDSVLLATLAPGNYTAQVSGVGATTGTALVELYDVDNPTPYSSQKVINISTRAVVGTGQNQLIAGFVVSGTTAKKLLIRAVGPTIGAPPFNVPGVLADPFLRIVQILNTGNLVVRENDNWEAGNDVSLVNAAAVSAGAFPLASGGKDSAILITLPPGSYSAQVTGNGGTTGVALVEVYEVP